MLCNSKNNHKHVQQWKMLRYLTDIAYSKIAWIIIQIVRHYDTDDMKTFSSLTQIAESCQQLLVHNSTQSQHIHINNFSWIDHIDKASFIIKRNKNLNVEELPLQ